MKKHFYIINLNDKNYNALRQSEDSALNNSMNFQKSKKNVTSENWTETFHEGYFLPTEIGEFIANAIERVDDFKN